MKWFAEKNWEIKNMMWFLINVCMDDDMSLILDIHCFYILILYSTSITLIIAYPYRSLFLFPKSNVISLQAQWAAVKGS